jgi:hypothetical protein
MEYRWLEMDEIEAIVNPICRERGWAELNLNPVQPTCRVLGAFEGEFCVAFLALQMHPVLGPFWSGLEHSAGAVSRELADRMHEFLVDTKARAVLTICESPVSERLAKRHDMLPVKFPVYEWIGRF